MAGGRGTTSAGHHGEADLPDAELAPQGLRATRFDLGSDQLVVFSFPLKTVEAPDVLSSSERAVALAVLAGLSNAAIARQRGTSVRTVANQVAAIFRKLGVSSRSELHVRLMSAAPGEPGDG
jgi:DNA-binding NarL/FixJ family response regulator